MPQPGERWAEALEPRHLLCAWPGAHTGASGHLSAAGATVTFAWENGANNPLERFEAQGAAVNDTLYVIGGFFNGQIQATRRGDVYDPVADTWAPIADMPEPITHAGQAVDGNLIYLAGGFLGDHPGASVDFVRVYDTSANTWHNSPSLPDDRGGGALVRLGRELHYFGGGTRPAGGGEIIDFGSHWVLQLGPTASRDDDGGVWTSAADMPNPRNHIGGAAANGRVYAVGGQHGHDEINANQVDIHRYDPDKDEWSDAADMPRPLGHITSTTVAANERIIVAGGTTSGGAPSPHVIEYDLASDTWVALPALPGPRQSPVSGVVGDQLIVSTGSLTTTTWIGVLEGTWETPAANGTATMPVPLAEVASGVVGKTLYVVGSGSAATLAYDLSTNQWSPANALPTRPFPGDHHAAEVVNGKLYLFGGLGASSGGKVQIFDPVANMWTRGADVPFAVGSSASALIGGEVYVAGGRTFATTDQFAKYNPSTNSWTPLPVMPQGVNHAAAATDGRRLFVFGGRGQGEVELDTIQIYDPVTNAWTSNLAPGSTLAPLPQSRGGTGKAVYVNGEFYIFGGETFVAGGPPNGVFDRVDVYNPVTNTWRLDTPMPTARHGIFPVAHAGRVYVAAGGTQAGASSSTILEIYNPHLRPIVTNAGFAFQTAPQRLNFTFNENVSASLGVDDLLLENLTTGATIPAANIALTYDDATNTARYTFPGYAFGALPDGAYRATLLAAGVIDTAGNTLPANAAHEFFFINGDANRDRRVNLQDFNILAANFGQSPRDFTQGDFNYDAVVNLSDFNILAGRFGAAVAPGGASALPTHSLRGGLLSGAGALDDELNLPRV